MRVIAHYPESEQVARFCQGSGCRPAADSLVPTEELEDRAKSSDEIVILGRGANTHHADIDHIQVLKAIHGLHGSCDLSVVCFDWHHDVDNELGGTELTSASWIFYGLEHDLFANAWIVGGHPTLDSDVDPRTGKALSEDWMLIRMLDRIRLFTAAQGTACLRYDASYADFLEGNPSISEYVVSPDGSSVGVTYKTWHEADYRELRSNAVVSIDLDVLADSEVRSDCPQGVFGVHDLITAIESLKPHTRIIGWTICGMDLTSGPLDERSLRTISRVVSGCTQPDPTPGKEPER